VQGRVALAARAGPARLGRTLPSRSTDEQAADYQAQPHRAPAEQAHQIASQASRRPAGGMLRIIVF